MPLTDNQIERYSRQIIVPGVGGRAQQRLLESCAAIVGEPADAASALAYLTGAGVGQIVMHPVGDRAPYAAIVERMRDLNPDVRVKIANDETPSQCDLILALVGGAVSCGSGRAPVECAARRCARGAGNPLRRCNRRAARYAGANRADAGAAALSSMR